MSEAEHVYKTIEITGTSRDSVEDAVTGALKRTGESVHNLRWFEISDIRGQIADGRVDHYQVTLKIGFTIDG